MNLSSKPPAARYGSGASGWSAACAQLRPAARRALQHHETRELVAKAGVVGEAGALRDRVAPGLASRDGAQDGAVLRDVSKAYFLLDGRLYELPNFAPGRER